MCQDGNSSSDGETAGESSEDRDAGSDSSEDELFRLLVEQDDDDREFLEGMIMFGIHYDTYCNKAKRRKPIQTGLDWVERNIRERNKCYNLFRMSPQIFDRLHDLL
jgi:hypothetical protein